MNRKVLISWVVIFVLLFSVGSYISINRNASNENEKGYSSLVTDMQVKKKIEKSIKIGVDNRMPPYSYVNDNGIIKGFYIDVLRAIAIEQGIDIEIYPMPWNELERNINSGEIDGVFGMSYDITDLDLILSDPVFESSEAIFVRSDNKYIVNIEDLSLVEVAIQDWQLEPDLISGLDKSKVTYVENQQQGIQMIMMGQVEAFIGDSLSGLYTIQKWKQENFIKIVGDDIKTKTYHIALDKHEEDTMEILNSGLSTIVSNGAYDKISEKWFGKEISTDGETIKKIIIVTGIVLSVVMLILFLILRWNKQLKIEVEKQTMQIQSASEQLMIQKNQLESNYTFRQEILNSLLSGIVTFTRSHEITYVNSSAVDILKLNERMILKRNVHETVFSGFIKELNIEEILSEDKYLRGKEIHLEHGGSLKTFNCNIYPLKDVDESKTGYILNFRDVSEEKRIRIELNRKDRMQALGLMVGGLAHEIRNPLTSIKALIDLVPSKIDNPKFREKIMEIVPSEIKRLNDLITNLLEYSKPKALKKEQIKVNDVFRTIGILFSANLKNKNIEYKYDEEVNISLFTDRNQIQQVLINIIINSIEAISGGGVINLLSNQTDAYTEIIIKDSGSGISEADIDKIMDPFYTTKASGTGLGLFITYQIINEYNGCLDFARNPEGGTIVTIKIPREGNGETNEQNINCR